MNFILPPRFPSFSYDLVSPGSARSTSLAKSGRS